MFKPTRFSNRRRDETYPSQIAADRPALSARIHCEEDYMEFDAANESVLRGKPRAHYEHEHEERESMCDRFNHELRAGHGFRNEGED